METRPAILFLLLFLMALVACDKTEPELLSGDIAGFVWAYNENFYLEEDMSGVQVSIRDETFDTQTITDLSGKFLFEDIDYGNYLVDLEMEGYFTTYTDYPLHHVGGYSPTLVNYYIHKIPTFETYIDSIHFDETNCRIYFYVNLQGLSGLPKFEYAYWCFFSDSPAISMDQFVSDDVGFLYAWELDGQLGSIMVEVWDNRFEQLRSDTIYCRVYPRANGPALYDFYPESLGKASNVFSFVVE